MLSSLILLLFGFYLLFFLFRTRRPKHFPPGPLPLPLFGNLLQLNPSNPLEDLKKLSERYGKVYSIYIGSRPVVVLNGLQAMKEALVTQSVEFAGRPQDLMVNHIAGSKGVILADYGLSWQKHRRFTLTCLRNFGLGKRSMEERILGETLHLYDAVPLCRNLPLPFRRIFQNYSDVREHVQGIVSQQEKSRVPVETRHLIDCYLDEMEKQGDNNICFHKSQMVALLLDLLFAGTDTTSNTLLTTFLYLMTHPHVQESCQNEIDEVLGDKEQASFEDRHKMPYTQATIHEAQRVADTVPLSVLHATTKDTRLMGYDIPKGTVIIPNLSSVLSEENQWKFPHDFNPSNFLNDQGEFVKPEAFKAFSTGSRVCLGESLARMELFLILVTLLRRFKFVWPEESGVPDYTPVFGVTQAPKPYRLGVRLREKLGKRCTLG